MILETPRLRLRPFAPGDRAALRRLVREKEAGPESAWDYAWPTDDAGLRNVSEWIERSDAFFAVCLREGPERDPIGFVSITPENAGTVCNLGYFLSPRHRGHGFAFEACAEPLRYAFDVLGADRAAAGTAVANLPSVRLLGRLGFTPSGPDQEGSLRRSPAGEPIRFLGRSFTLERAEWAEAVNRVR
ncbi:MAG: GNAT family N-acetyltransferase [Clostridia bacterium]|nr:GNAT family N-acetyltransferase [Clostridia bacterium]